MRKILVFVKWLLIVIVTISLVMILVVNVTPRPMTYLAKKFIFDPTPMNKPVSNNQDLLENIIITKDEEYVSPYANNTYDIYTPLNTKGPTPVIIWAHGGGFVGGDKAMVKDYATVFANEGYTVIAMNYPLAPKGRYPDPIFAVDAMVQDLEKNKDLLNIDMKQIVFAGDSAGAQIVSQYVNTQLDHDYATEIGIPHTLINTDIKGMVLYCGIYRIEDLADSDNGFINFLFGQLGWSYLGEKDWIKSDRIYQASVTDHVNKMFPPTYITDGNVASFENSAKSLEAQLLDLNVPVVSRFFEDDKSLMHEFQFNLETEEGLLVLEDTLSFLKSRFGVR